LDECFGQPREKQKPYSSILLDELFTLTERRMRIENTLLLAKEFDDETERRPHSVPPADSPQSNGHVTIAVTIRPVEGQSLLDTPETSSQSVTLAKGRKTKAKG
jgi:hypothetical protein